VVAASSTLNIPLKAHTTGDLLGWRTYLRNELAGISQCISLNPKDSLLTEEIVLCFWSGCFIFARAHCYFFALQISAEQPLLTVRPLERCVTRIQHCPQLPPWAGVLFRASPTTKPLQNM